MVEEEEEEEEEEEKEKKEVMGKLAILYFNVTYDDGAVSYLPEDGNN